MFWRCVLHCVSVLCLFSLFHIQYLFLSFCLLHLSLPTFMSWLETGLVIFCLPGSASGSPVYLQLISNYKENTVKVGKNLHRLQLILFSKITGAFLFRIFSGFLHVPTTEIYCLTSAIISETHIIIIAIHNKTIPHNTLFIAHKQKSLLPKQHPIHIYCTVQHIYSLAPTGHIYQIQYWDQYIKESLWISLVLFMTLPLRKSL